MANDEIETGMKPTSAGVFIWEAKKHTRRIVFLIFSLLPVVMFCSLSGKPCVEPVVSRTTGHVFDRSAIVHHLESQGPTCPVTNTPLTQDDLIAIATTGKSAAANGTGTGTGPAVLPRDAKLATSIPGLLHAFQMEWDATVVETHRIKVQNAQLRQELSRALYQNDAACRTVARLLAEKEALAAQVAELKRHVRAGTAPVAAAAAATVAAPSQDTDAMDVDTPTATAASPAAPAAELPAAVLTDFADTAARLSATRKKRKTPTTATPDLMASSFTSTPLLDISHSGIAAVATPPTLTNTDPTLLAARSAHRGALALDVARGTSATFPAPLKQSNVSAIVMVDPEKALVAACVRDRVVLATPTGVVADTPADFGTSAKDLATHCAVHPSGRYLAVTSQAGALALFQMSGDDDTPKLTKLYQVQVPVSQTGVISHVAFHPDGNLLAVATATRGVLVYTATTGVEATAPLASEAMHAAGPVTALRFLENGFHLAVAAGTQTFVWDLRKLSVTGTLPSTEGVTCVAGDYTGTYVAVGHKAGQVSIWVYASKTWSPVVEHAQVLAPGHAVSALVWGKDSRKVYVAGSESKQVVVFGMAE